MYLINEFASQILWCLVQVGVQWTGQYYSGGGQVCCVHTPSPSHFRVSHVMPYVKHSRAKNSTVRVPECMGEAV